MRSYLSTPPSAAKGPPARPALARRDHARGPCATARLPSCPQNFLPNLTKSLAISRVSLVYLYVPLTFQRIGQRGDSNRLPAARIPLRFARCPCTQTAICAAAVSHPHHINHVNHSSDKCQRALAHALTPVSTPPSAAKGPPARPALARRDHARGPCATARLPSCPQNFLPNLTHSLVISRVTLVHLPCLSTPPSAAKMLLTSIPFETGTLPANATTVSWPSRLPLHNTKYAIQRPTCSVPLAGA